MKPGATLSDTKSLTNLKSRYCTLQFLKTTIEDQQRVILFEMMEMKNE